MQSLWCLHPCEAAETLASSLGLSLTTVPPRDQWYLAYEEGLLACVNNEMRIWVDYQSKSFQHRLHSTNKQDPLLRALGLHKKGKGLTDESVLICDCTAGFGYDGLLMASQGARVILIEQSPIVYAMLENGIKRSQPWLEQNQIDIQLIQANSLDWLRARTESQHPDIIYLDPMYDDKKTKSKSQGSMQCLQAITQPTDHHSLFTQAMPCCTKRLVVKRPKNAHTLGGSPSFNTQGKSHRFDVYLT